jgi:hypothetical protein
MAASPAKTAMETAMKDQTQESTSFSMAHDDHQTASAGQDDSGKATLHGLDYFGIAPSHSRITGSGAGSAV